MTNQKLVCLWNHILEQNNVSQERFKTLYLILLNTLLGSIDIKQRELDARGAGGGGNTIWYIYRNDVSLITTQAIQIEPTC